MKSSGLYIRARRLNHTMKFVFLLLQWSRRAHLLRVFQYQVSELIYAGEDTTDDATIRCPEERAAADERLHLVTHRRRRFANVDTSAIHQWTMNDSQLAITQFAHFHRRR